MRNARTSTARTNPRQMTVAGSLFQEALREDCPAAVAFSTLVFIRSYSADGYSVLPPRNKKGLGKPRPFDCSRRNSLLQRRVDRGELGVDGTAQRVDDGDDRERDAGGDQAVF